MTLDQRDQKIEDLSVEVTRLRAQVATLEKQLAMAKAAQGHSHMYVRELPAKSSVFSLEGSSLQNKKPNKRKVLREG